MSGEPKWSVEVLEPAAKDLERLDPPVADRILAKLEWLQEYANHVVHRPLHGDLAGLNKLPVGDWRVIYEVLPDQRRLVVHAVGHRRQVYKR